MKINTDPVLVSACLQGLPCRYNGKPLEVRTLPVSRDRMILVCPEELGGLTTPRSAAFFDHDTSGQGVWNGTARVVTEAGEDRSHAFRIGAQRVLDIAGENGARIAYLKERSPSCGVCQVYLAREPIPGKGVTTALLERNGIQVVGVD